MTLQQTIKDIRQDLEIIQKEYYINIDFKHKLYDNVLAKINNLQLRLEEKNINPDMS